MFSFVSMSAPVTPTTPRQNSSPNGAPITPVSAPPERKNDTRPAFTTNSFHTTTYQQHTMRKRRENTLGDAGPFFSQSAWRRGSAFHVRRPGRSEQSTIRPTGACPKRRAMDCRARPTAPQNRGARRTQCHPMVSLLPRRAGLGGVATSAG